MSNNTQTELYSHISVLRGLTCRRLLYLHKNRPELKTFTPGLNNLIGRRNGFVKELAVSNLARNIEFFRISDSNTMFAKLKTSELLEKSEIFIQKPVFIYDRLYTSFEAIKKQDGKIILYNIQVRTAGKRSHLNSLGYQYAIVRLSGVPVNDVVVVTLNPEYIYKGAEFEEILFSGESVISKLDEDFSEYEGGLKSILENFPAEDEPPAELGRHCFKGGTCTFFEYCFPDVKSSKLMGLGGMHLDDKLELIAEGKTSLDDLPEEIELNEFGKIQLATRDGKRTIVDYAGLRDFFSTFKYPLFYTDFEAIQPALPVYKNTEPYRQIPFQFYLVKEEKDKEEFTSFLPESKEDPRRNFLEAFIEKTKGEGSIIVFDKTSEIKMLRELVKYVPEREFEVNEIIERIVDLKEPFDKMYFYHYEMKGSKTLKNIVAVINKDKLYEELEIANGGSASFLYELYLYGIIDTDEETLKRNLTDYCKTDVVAMVEIVRFLKKISGYES